MTVNELCCCAAKAKGAMASSSGSARDNVLRGFAALLRQNVVEIVAANLLDCEAARAEGRSEAFIERLTLTPARIEAAAASIESLCSLPDPVGEVVGGSTRPNGLKITERRVPLGVIAIIFESRPNVAADAAALAIKSGNAVVLRGGSEAINSNRAIVALARRSLAENQLPADAVCLVEDITRESARQLMEQRGLVDLLIPRGGHGLIKAVVEGAKVPVIETGAGNCHIYVDSAADLKKALDIAENAKMSRPSTCNAAETLLCHADVAERFLPMLAERLAGRCELRGCGRSLKILSGIAPADEQDWYEEYNDYILAVKVVDSLDEAIEHINRCGTRHSEAIVTENVGAAERFLSEVDAAAVYLNASTRFTDGGEFGLGCEIGISTAKLHARGPMGLRALTTTKFTVLGDGQVR